jgi:hypothetical protein
MSPDRKKIYAFVENNPNITVNDVVKATKLSRSLCYKFLSTEHFSSQLIKNENGQCMYFKINENRVIANGELPRHHELHRAFWGVAA